MVNVITKNAVFITGTIFFFGFFKYQSYYYNFDIEIYRYLTAFELSKAFVSIIIEYLLPIAVIHCGFILLESLSWLFKSKEARRAYHRGLDVRTPMRLGYHVLFKKRIGAFHKLCLLRDILKHPLTPLIVFFGLFSAYFLDSILFQQVKWRAETFLLSNETMFYLVSAVWLIGIWEPILVHVVVSQLKRLPTSKDLWLLKGISYSLILLYFLHFSQRINAMEKLHGEVAEQYVFSLKSGENIHTSKDTLLIGETEGFVFLRDNVHNSNLIFERSEVKRVSQQTGFDPANTFFSKPWPAEKFDSLMNLALPWARRKVAAK